MSDVHTEGLLHRLTHKAPGVPAHTDRPRGHQGRPHEAHGRSPRGHQGRSPRLEGLSPSFHHTAGRPPRVLAGWQRRIAAFFGRELP